MWAAKARGEGASERVGELFEMLRQQRAILEALTSTVARSEAEALCLQRAVHVADLQAATLAAHPTVGDDTAAEFGALAARLPHADGGVASTARESIASSSSDGSEELQSVDGRPQASGRGAHWRPQRGLTQHYTAADACTRTAY